MEMLFCKDGCHNGDGIGNADNEKERDKRKGTKKKNRIGLLTPFSGIFLLLSYGIRYAVWDFQHICPAVAGTGIWQTL